MKVNVITDKGSGLINEDIEKIKDLFLLGGLEKIKEYVRKLENTDLECLRYPRFKPHDDLTAISITF